VDPKLAAHLQSEKVELDTFAIPWINCLLLRSLPLHLVWRLYDTYFCEDIALFHTFVCASFLTSFSASLRQMVFQEILMFLQTPPTAKWGNDEVEVLLSQAYLYKSLFAK
jgi:TBC1 domain family member 2